jgi:hypothetical protein
MVVPLHGERQTPSSVNHHRQTAGIEEPSIRSGRQAWRPDQSGDRFEVVPVSRGSRPCRHPPRMIRCSTALGGATIAPANL